MLRILRRTGSPGTTSPRRCVFRRRRCVTAWSTARDLTERLPATLALLRAGQITQRHACDLAEASRSLTPETATQVEAAVVERAPEQTVAQFRAAVRRAVLTVTSPAEEEKAHTDAREQRRVELHPDEHGTAWITAYLPADDTASVLAALNAVANQSIHSPGGYSRTADQRRADALIDLCSAALTDPHLVKAHGQRPTIHVTLAASTLMGLNQQPADLDGYRPITAAIASRIAADPTAQWRRLLTDDHGLVHHAGSKTYRPPADITRTVIARDVHCTFPGCRTHAAHNDLDHIHAYHQGDHTTIDNLMSLCRRHHRLKHTAGDGPCGATNEPAPPPGPTDADAPTGRGHPPAPPPPPGPGRMKPARPQPPIRRPPAQDHSSGSRPTALLTGSP